MPYVRMTYFVPRVRIYALVLILEEEQFFFNELFCVFCFQN